MLKLFYVRLELLNYTRDEMRPPGIRTQKGFFYIYINIWILSIKIQRKKSIKSHCKNQTFCSFTKHFRSVEAFCVSVTESVLMSVVKIPHHFLGRPLPSHPDRPLQLPKTKNQRVTFTKQCNLKPRCVWCLREKVCFIFNII